MTSYLDWNDALARHFFRPESAGQPVWLFVTDEVLREIGSAIGSDRPSFIEAVKLGPPWATAGSLCQRALHAYHAWRDRRLDFPPYLAYLSLFVLAAGLEGDFARHAYYPRLHALLRESEERAPPSFDRMLVLWDDLERWSTHDRSGDLGLFEARIVGGHIHVGLPIAQTILSEDERRALPQMFAQAGLDATSPPPDDELARILRNQGGAVLRPRTRELIRTRRDPESYAVLLDAVAEELAEWDGTYDELSEGAGVARKRTFGSLRLCIAFDRVAGRLFASLRCRLRGEFSLRGLQLKGRGLPQLLCEDSGIPGWSTRLLELGTSEQFDAGGVDWSDGVALSEERLGWDFALPKRSVRIFAEGRAEGLPDLIEVGHVQRAQRMYFLYREVDWPQLAEWAKEECRDFTALSVRAGIRAGWQLATCSEVTGDRRVRSAFPELALPERVRLALVGGIRSGLGSTYFPFAAPSLSLEGGDGREYVRCDGRELGAAPLGRSYAIPDDLPTECRITLEVARDGQALKRRSLYLTGRFEWRLATPQWLLDEFGRPASEAETAMAGALTVGRRPPTDGFSRPLMLTPGIDLGAPRVLFIGRVPGQICSWPNEPHDAGWSPVWAIPMGRRGRAVYCGGDIDADLVALEERHGDRRRVKLWQRTLWHRRKRVREPEDPVLADLWRSYVDVARLV